MGIPVAISETATRLPERAIPTRLDALLFQAKVNVFRAQRAVREFGRAPTRLAKADPSAFATTVAESRTPLWGDPRLGERAMQRGKVHNLRAATRLLDRTLLPAGSTFSFWRQLGRASAAKGFVSGRMLQEGCLVPATGGGLCQLSNALYDVALKADCDIVERHAHSRIVPGSTAARGRDATIAWNYVDLRFAPKQELMLRVLVERDALVVRLDAAGPDTLPQSLRTEVSAFALEQAPAHTCGTCDETSCFRHEDRFTTPTGRTAFLVDENWPEFRDYVAQHRATDDVLALPLDGARWKAPRYAWDTQGFGKVIPATLTALWRSLALRRAKDGPERRAAELRGAEALARRFAQTLTADVTEVAVAQSLLPWLWRAGHLGGRRFTVLMTHLPMTEIQSRLNAAAQKHPERRTLADFRADGGLVAAESEALAQADAIVTPHTEVAALFGDRAIRLEWKRPASRPPIAPVGARRIAFVGPTIARKGAYELREAATALNLEVVALGSALEGTDFWHGVRMAAPDRENWLNGVAAVVQPAVLEDAPRRLLLSLASGVPVIATRACGLPEQDGLTLVPDGDSDGLIAALRALGIP
jgi:hypothetical protein